MIWKQLQIIYQVYKKLLISSLLFFCSAQLLMAMEEVKDKFMAGKHYNVLSTIDENMKSSDTVKILELFSFNCKGCQEIEKVLHKWVEEKNNISFARLPLVFSIASKDAAISYYIAQSYGLAEVFTGQVFSHSHKDGKLNIPSKEELISFLEMVGLSKQDVSKSWDNKLGIDVQMIANEKFMLANKLLIMPSFVINGKYWVNARMTDYSIKRLFEVIDYLINKSHTELAA